jgi:hypothetical protein
MKNMRNIKFFLWIGFLCLISFFGIKASAQETNVSAAAKVSAIIVSPIVIVKRADLNFGNILAGSDGSVVKIDPENAASVADGASLSLTNRGTVSAAKFSITGFPNATYTISVPSSILLTREGGSETLFVDGIVTSPSATGSLSDNGEQTISVGGTVHVEANQTPGTYSNENGLSVTVAYQ